MIRLVTSSDIECIIELLKTLHPNQSFSEDLIQKKISQISKQPHIKIIVFENEQKIVGMCTIIRNDGISYAGRPFAIIENVVVNKEYQGQKIGKKIITRAIETAKRWNCYKIILETGSKESWKLNFYKNCGFKTGEKTSFIKRL